MRVLYILPAEGFGGAERQGVVHVANLPRLGIEVVAAAGPGQPICTQLARAGVDDFLFCQDLPRAATPSAGLAGRLGRPFQYLRSWSRSVRALTSLGRRRAVDVVFASRTFGWVVGSAVARRLGVPVLWRAGSQPSRAAHTFALRYLAPLIAPDLLVANSELGCRTYAGLLHVPTAVLRNGVDTERFSPGRARQRLRHELGFGMAPVVGLAARPAPEKGLDCFARIAQTVGRAIPSVRFLIAGDFPLRARYQESFAAQGLAERVTFLGHVDDVESFYASCDVVVLTSGRQSIEMSSNAILEAMSTARPVVVTNVGGMTEAVRDGVDGFVVAPDDPASFSQRLSLLLANPELRRHFGDAARRRILAHYSQARVVADLAELLTLACRRESKPAPQSLVARAHKEAS